MWSMFTQLLIENAPKGVLGPQQSFGQHLHLKGGATGQIQLMQARVVVVWRSSICRSLLNQVQAGLGVAIHVCPGGRGLRFGTAPRASEWAVSVTDPRSWLGPGGARKSQ